MKTTNGYYLIASFLAASIPALAQNPPVGGWRRASDPPVAQVDPNSNQPAPPNEPANYPVPPQLTIKPGTFITVRIDQPLSSDRNQAGDTFAASLAKPIVVDGVVVAQRGQTIGGRVVEARKAGRVEGVSRLAIQLTDLTLVDGQPVAIQSHLVSRNGPTSEGRDAGAMAGTTLAGAAIGANVNGGVGAGVGAAAGVVVGAIGVLLTRGHPTIIYPESVLTFRIEAPATFSTERAPQAFRYMDPNEYERPYDANVRRPGPAGPCGTYGCGAPPPPPPPYYGPAAYPYYGPRVSFFYGPGFYFGRGYRGYRRW